MNGSPSPVDESTGSDLRVAVTGDVITPDDAGYEESHRLWNGAIDRHPAVFVHPASTDDVATAIATARCRCGAAATASPGRRSSMTAS